MSQYRNETARFVVRLPGLYRYEIPVFLAAYVEDGRPMLLCPEGSDEPIMATRWQVFQTLCRTRATSTVSGELRVDGAVVLPERYIGLWRTAAVAPVTPDELAASLAVTIRATLTAEREQVIASLSRVPKSTLASPDGLPDERPVRSMEEFDRRWERSLRTLTGAGDRFCATLDFRAKGAAADTYLFSELTLPSPYRRIVKVSLGLMPTQEHSVPLRAGPQPALPFPAEDAGHVV